MKGQNDVVFKTYLLIFIYIYIQNGTTLLLSMYCIYIVMKSGKHMAISV